MRRFGGETLRLKKKAFHEESNKESQSEVLMPDLSHRSNMLLDPTNRPEISK